MSDLKLSSMDFDSMDFKDLRNAVKACYKENIMLRDEIAIMKRKYEDIIYNLDDENFSSRFVKEKNNMRTSIEQTEEAITLQAERIDENEEEYKAQLKLTADAINAKVSVTDLNTKLNEYSTITQTAANITAAVNSEREYTTNMLGEKYYTKATVESKISASKDGIISTVSNTYQTQSDANEQYGELQTQIEQTENSILLTVGGKIEDSEQGIKEYYTGIGILENGIRMSHNSAYSIYNSDGLRFYDSSNQTEGWAIEPSASYGGVLNYYINGGNCYKFGTGESGTGYSETDMLIKAINGQRGRFVVDVSNSSNKEVKFVGLSHPTGLKENSPCIYANEKLLATQEWVLENAGGGTATAVFA